MAYPLSEHMTLRKLFLGCLPSVGMMVAISIYSVVDGFFVSNFAGKTQFASVNLIYPLIMVLGSVGFVMGTGGTALVAKRFGEGQIEEGNRLFSNCVLVTAALGILSSLITFFLLPHFAVLLGADEEMLPHCIAYGRILVLGITFFNLQNLFQSFFSTAEKGHLGFLVTISAGLTNILLDYLLVVVFRLGIIGAGIGTVCGQAVGAIVPLIYFIRKNSSSLRLRIHKIDWRGVWKMMGNGCSEFVTNISASAVSMVMNVLLMRYFGQNGVGAYGIICYVWMIFAASFIGYNIYVAPRIAFALGAQNKPELSNLYRKSHLFLMLMGLSMCGLSLALAVPISYAFAGYDPELLALTQKASFIYSLVYLFLGLNMFGSAFFTALNNGLVSLLLSIARLGLLEILCVILLPRFIGGDGIWWAIPLAEGLGMLLNLVTMFAFGPKYGYRKFNLGSPKS